MRIDEVNGAPDAFRSKLGREFRKAIGNLGLTQQQAEEKNIYDREKVLQDDIETWLWSQKIWNFREPMHKKRNGRRGIPDFLVCIPSPLGPSRPGIPFAIECKVANRKPTEEQVQEMFTMSASGYRTMIAYDLKSVIDKVRLLELEARNR